MALAACAAFALLQRDKDRQFGAIAYGGFPTFRLRTTDGVEFDNHKMKSQVWAVNVTMSAENALRVAEGLKVIEGLTSSGKRHLNALTIIDSSVPVFKPVMPFHLIVQASQEDINAIFRFAGKVNENVVYLVDQDNVIRGLYDLTDVDDYRKFQGDLLRIL